MRRTSVLSTVAATAALLITVPGIIATPPAGASSGSLVGRLLSTSTAKHLGFPSVADKAISSHKTGSKACATGAEVVFQNKKALTGLVDEVFTCTSASAAAKYMAKYKNSYKPTASMTPPASLGPIAIGSSDAPLFTYYWIHGTYGAFVAIDTDATSNSSVASAHRDDPLTPALLATLNSAAIKQNTQLG
jgi:hypothetical protein